MRAKIILITAVIAFAGFYVYAWRDALFESKRPSNYSTKECAGLRKLITSNVPIGSDERTLLKFYEMNHWSYDYDQRQNLYSTNIAIERKNGVVAHSVSIKVYLDPKKRVKEIEGTDSFLAP